MHLSAHLHFLEAATDRPITPAPEYKSTTVELRGTYLFSLCNKELNDCKKKQCDSKEMVREKLHEIANTKYTSFKHILDPCSSTQQNRWHMYSGVSSSLQPIELSRFFS